MPDKHTFTPPCPPLQLTPPLLIPHAADQPSPFHSARYQHGVEHNRVNRQAVDPAMEHAVRYHESHQTDIDAELRRCGPGVRE